MPEVDYKNLHYEQLNEPHIEIMDQIGYGFE